MTSDIVIIGAGLAGLTAARELSRRGLSVRVIEAHTRVGGRTLTETVRAGDHDVTLDLGAQWVGPAQRRMLALIAELGIATFPTHHQGDKLTEVGTGASRRQKRHRTTIPPVGLVSLLAMQRAIMVSDALIKQVPPGDPQSARRAAEWDAMTLETWKQRNLTPAARGLIDVAVRTVFGCEASELSMLWFLHYLRGGGGLVPLIEIENAAQETRVVGGTQQIAKRLAADLGDRLVLDAPVHAIEQDDSGVTVQARGVTARARRVVMTIPPSLAGRIQYTPALPFVREQLTSRMPMGATMKCIALYDRPFWREDGLSGEAISPEGPMSVIFDNTSHDGHASLLGFCVGQPARAFSDRPEAERRDAMLAQFARHFGERARTPIAYVEKDWAREPFARGCPVGNLGPGGVVPFATALRAPIGRLHFAGTETAREWTGFMEGAVESGERVAEEIAALERGA